MSWVGAHQRESAAGAVDGKVVKVSYGGAPSHYHVPGQFVRAGIPKRPYSAAAHYQFHTLLAAH